MKETSAAPCGRSSSMKLAVTTEALVLEAAPSSRSVPADTHTYNRSTLAAGGGCGPLAHSPVGALSSRSMRTVIVGSDHFLCHIHCRFYRPVEKWRLQLDVRTEACGTAGWERRPVDGIAVRVDADEARVAFPPDEFGRWQRDRHGRWWHFHSD